VYICHVAKTMLFGKRGSFSAGHAEAGGLDHQLEVQGTARGLEGLLVVDPVPFDQLKDACRLVEYLHQRVAAWSLPSLRSSED
jgi:hypothetical protein